MIAKLFTYSVSNLPLNIASQGVICILREVWAGLGLKVQRSFHVQILLYQPPSPHLASDSPKVSIREKSAEIQFTEQICVLFVMGRHQARQGEVSRGYGDLVGMGAR